MKAAFLGLGIMGCPMAGNIAKSGIELIAWNRTAKPEIIKQIEQAGGIYTENPEDAVIDAEIICLCFTDEKAINELFFEFNQLVDLITNKNVIIIDFSTIAPIAAICLYGKFAEKGISFIDAPVTGGDIGARNGTLTIMAAGRKADYDKAGPVFNSVGKNIYYCGESGNGQKVKEINQLLGAVHMLAVSEALLMAEKMELDPKLVIEICSSGAAGSWALANLGKRITNNDFSPGFMIRHMLKDLKIVSETATGTGTYLPALELAHKMFLQADKIQTEKNAELGTQAMFLAYKEADIKD
jgi:3-hydroxyisobutyrate dehydrogenase